MSVYIDGKVGAVAAQSVCDFYNKELFKRAQETVPIGDILDGHVGRMEFKEWTAEFIEPEMSYKIDYLSTPEDDTTQIEEFKQSLNTITEF